MNLRTVQLSAGMALFAAVALLAGCLKSTDNSVTGAQPDAGEPAATASAPPARAPSSIPPPAEVHADELGQIPVLMIHQVQPEAEGDYAQTPSQLRASLEYLAKHDYQPITAAELVNRTFDLPAGASPVVLTFDDGYDNQFKLRPDGSVEPKSAVGVLQTFAQSHPGFRAVGTMYLNQQPFGQPDGARELRWLIDHGWEIGNHTTTHANLSELSTDGVQKEIAEEQRAIIEALPGYTVTTMALPFGAMPDDPALAHRGEFNGVSYDYHGVMLVGANPAPSPFAADWDPYNVPRIRSWHGQTDSDEDYWMPRLEKTKYISDGDPTKISFPRSGAAEVAEEFAGRANPY